MNPKKISIPLNILLAEDDLQDQDFFETALKDLPVATRLTTVRDGERLMKYLSENCKYFPHILFLDLSMPRKTGFECLTEIKESERLKNLPVVVFTTSFSGMNFEKSMANTLTNLGAMEYIRKSSDLEELKQNLYKILIAAIGKVPLN